MNKIKQYNVKYYGNLLIKYVKNIKFNKKI
jgi:hypothetical protein